MNTPRFGPVAGAVLLAATVQAQGLEQKTVYGTRLDGDPVFGMDLRPRAELSYVTFKPGATLKGADLRGANLEGALLDGVDLRGADLAGANLAEASLIGALLDAPLDPRTVRLRNTLGPEGGLWNARNPDGGPYRLEPLPTHSPRPAREAPEARRGPSIVWKRVSLEAFFEPDLPRGSIRFISLEEDEPLPRKLVAFPGGIGWIGERSKRIRVLKPEGPGDWWSEFPLVDAGCSGSTNWFLPADGRDLLWGQWTRLVESRLSGQDVPRAGVFSFEEDKGYAPGQVLCTPRDLVYFRPEEGTLTVDPLSRVTALKHVKSWLSKAFELESAQPGDDFISLERGPGEQILVNRKLSLTWGEVAHHEAFKFFTPPPCPDRKVLVTQAGVVWCTTGTPGELYTFELKAPQEGLLLDDGKRQAIASLAEGPDGSIWMARAGGLAELKPRLRQVVSLPLPQGLRPTQIVRGGDGALYVLFEGRRLLGRITAVAPAQAAAPAAPANLDAAAAAPLPAPAPVAPRPKARRPDDFDWLRAQPEPEAKAPAPAAAFAAQAAAGAIPAPVPAIAPQIGIALDQILKKHAFDVNPEKSQFTRSGSTREGVAALIRAVLAAPDGPAVLNVAGRWEVGRDFGRTIGFTDDHGRWAPATKLKVVLSPGQDHVITAYPVKAF